MRLSTLLFAGGFGLAALSGAALTTLASFNHFARIRPHFDGACVEVKGVSGPEDIQVAPGAGRAFVSSLDRRASRDARGAIYSVAVDDPLDADGWRDRTGGVPARFRPLGLSYYKNGETRRLFVVNEAGPAVEIYDVAANGDLEHLKTVSELRLTSPNDVVATGAEQFYVSNDVAPGRSTLLGQLYFVARVASGKVFYFDGGAMSVAAEGLRFANGLALGKNGTRLYVGETAGRAVRFFDRDPATGVLSETGTQRVDAAVDNINVAFDGALWVGALPKPLLTPLLARDPAAEAPSAIFRLTDDGANGSAPTEVFLSTGADIAGATTAAVEGRKLLIGALYGDKYLNCDLPG